MAVRTKKSHRATSGGSQAPLTPKQMTAAAAAKWHVPYWLLWGVKVAETGSTGTGIGQVSSTGAQGPFQFEPETAAAYGVNVNNFQSSADGAAHYLHDLKKEHGTWDAALRAYSGGGYGVAHVKAGAKGAGLTPANSQQKAGAELVDLEAPGGINIPFPGPNVPVTPFQGLGGVGGGILSSPEELLQAADSARNLFEMLTDVHFWIRVGEAIAALILIYMGLHSLTGQGPSPSGAAKTAVEAGTAAVVAPK